MAGVTQVCDGQVGLVQLAHRVTCAPGAERLPWGPAVQSRCSGGLPRARSLCWLVTFSCIRHRIRTPNFGMLRAVCCNSLDKSHGSCATVSSRYGWRSSTVNRPSTAPVSPMLRVRGSSAPEEGQPSRCGLPPGARAAGEFRLACCSCIPCRPCYRRRLRTVSPWLVSAYAPKSR